MKLIQKGGLFGIVKAEIDELIAAKKFIGLNRSPRAEQVIVSLTSYKPRIHDIKYTLYSLLNQAFPPDKLILWLDEDSFPRREEDLPQDLLEFKSFGLTIDWCENLRSYKKLIPALEKYPDALIITADDDLFYRPDWLKILYDAHLAAPDCAIAHRAHRIRFDAQGNIYPYVLWHWEIPSTTLTQHCYKNFSTNGAGALFKKNFFHSDVTKRELFTELSPRADDIWFWAMTVLKGTKIFIPPAAHRNLIYVDLDTELGTETLWAVNRTQNDVQLRRVLERYPAVLDKLIREVAESKPYVSVVLPVRNAANITTHLQNIFLQRFPDFELILINLGSRTNSATLPTNFRVIHYPKAGLAAALNLGLQKAAGNYVLFADENSIFAETALEDVAKAADDSTADVIHFAGHWQIDAGNRKFILDDSPMLETDKPQVFDAPRQLRADFWLQRRLSRRLDTKIFKREFLIKHGITFGNETAEFMFHALIQAEKYLLVPNAFCFCK